MCSILQHGPAASGDFGCAQAGCQACLDALLREHTGLIHTILRRVAHAGVPYEELVQAGRLALWRAVRGFDPARGVRFSTYGGRAIERALWHAVRQARQPERVLPALEPPEPEPGPAVRAALLAAVQRLPPRLQGVLLAVYGLDEQPPWSRAAVGRCWGLSRERIRQLHDEALVLLRHPGYSPSLSQVCAQDTRASYQQTLRATRAWQRRRR